MHFLYGPRTNEFSPCVEGGFTNIPATCTQIQDTYLKITQTLFQRGDRTRDTVHTASICLMLKQFDNRKSNLLRPICSVANVHPT